MNLFLSVFDRLKQKKKKKKKKEKFQNSIPQNWITDHKADIHFRVSRGGRKPSDRGEDRVINRSRVSRLVKPFQAFTVILRAEITRPDPKTWLDLASSLSVVRVPRSSRQKRSRSTASRHATKPNASPIAIARGRISFPKRGEVAYRVAAEGETSMLHTRWMSAAKANGATVSGRFSAFFAA